VVNTQISQTKKLPITQLIKALHGFEKGRDRQTAEIGKSLHKKLAEPLADPDTGEVLVEKGSIVTNRVIAGLNEEQLKLTTLFESPLGTTDEMLWALGEERTLNKPTVEELEGFRPLDAIKDAEGKVIVNAMQRIEHDGAVKIAAMELEGLEILAVQPYVEATLNADRTQNTREAILDIYKRMRPGEAANEDAAKQLVYSLFFDMRRYDMGRVGRRHMNNRLGLNVTLETRNLTSDDLAGSILAMGPYLQKEAEHDDIDDLRNKRVRSVGELLQSQMRLGFVRMETVSR
ncbi:MAG: hypothetical protein ABUL72_05210, partial [Armatimonadota bacterium]